MLKKKLCAINFISVFNTLGRPKVRENDLDPMDPAAYSEAPRYVKNLNYLVLFLLLFIELIFTKN